MATISMVDKSGSPGEAKSRGEVKEGVARALHVLHVINVETSNYYLNNLVDYTSKEDIEFFFVTFGSEGSFVDDLRRRGVTAYALNIGSRSSYFRAVRELSRIIKRHEIDIVHTHLFDPTYLGLIAARLHGRKMIFTRHHSISLYVNPSWIKRKVYLLIEKFVNARADHIIVPSRLVKEILIGKEQVPQAKVSLVPYGQTVERFDAVSPARIEELRRELNVGDALSLVFVARLFGRKGHSELFTALAALLKKGLNLQLYLVGAGPERTKIEQLARDLGIEKHVHCLGWRDDALAVIAGADIVVHPSLEETLPSAVIEALMLERPIVASDVGGVRDILGDSEYGQIVPPGDPVALGSALEATINNLEDARERARRGRQHVVKYMDAGRVARAYTECYNNVSDKLLACR